MSERYIKVLSSNTGKGFITHEDWEVSNLTFSFKVSDETHSYYLVTGEEANIDAWQTRVGGETSSLEVVNDLIEALPPSESERLNFVESALDTLLGG